MDPNRKYNGQNIEKVFMFVKDYCHFSKCAAGCCTYPLTCLNVHNSFHVVKYEDGVFKKIEDEVDEEYITNYNKIKNIHRTVPQVFVYSKNKWYYVGGCNDFIKIIGGSKGTGSHTSYQVKF